MRSNKLFHYSLSVLLVILLLGGLVFLNLAVQRNNASQQSQRQDMSKLNVALVNEDSPIADEEGRTYQLGASYVKSLEKDDSHNWTVTSRAVAEKGLDANKYQLLVIIPGNFSAKVLDIQGLAANQALVSYEVNANGNSQVETAANRLGSQIVADLNSQLVNMYMASILENLYLAQQNVMALANVQANNIGVYSSDVYKSALGFQDDFAPMLALAESSLSANDSLLDSLSQSHSNLMSQSASAAEPAERTETGLVSTAQLPETSASPEADASRRLALSNTELTASLQQLLSLVQQNQALLEKAEAQNDAGGLDALVPDDLADSEPDNSYSRLVSQMQEEIDRLDGELKSLEDENKAQAELVTQRLSEKLRAYYGKEKDTSISLREFLEKNKGQEEIASLEAQQTSIKETLNRLPSLDTAAVRGDMSALGEESLTFAQADYAQSYYGEDFEGSDLGSRLAAAKEKLEQRLSDAAGQSGQVTYHYNGGATGDDGDDQAEAPEANAGAPESESSTSSEGDNPQQDETEAGGRLAPAPAAYVRRLAQARPVSARVTVSLPDIVSLEGLTVNGQSLTNGGTVSLAEGANPIAVDFRYKPAAEQPADAQLIRITVQPDQGAAVTQVIPVDLSPYLNADYTQAVADYSRLVQEVQDAYRSADAVLAATSVQDAAGQRRPLSSILDRDISAYLEDIVSSSLTLAYGGTEPTSVTQLRETKTRLEENLAALKETNANLSSDLSRLIETAGSLQEAPELPAEPTAAADSETETAASPSDLASLQEDSAAIRSDSEARLTRAQGVNSSFQAFKNDVETAQKNSVALSQSADDLMQAFDKELEDNGNFVDAFSKVFGNAYSNGVANEVLLDFLSQPVTATSSSVQSRANVHRPFAWVVLLAIITLFAAYVFGTQPFFERVKDRFKLTRLTRADLISTGVLTGLSVLIGIVLGLVSAGQLSIGQAALPSWIFLLIILSIILVLSQYWLIRQFRILGMGLSFFMLVSYMSLTSAIGMTVSVSGGLALLARVNFLTYVERLFLAFFSGEMIGLGTVVILLLLSLALIALSIIAPGLKDRLAKGD